MQSYHKRDKFDYAIMGIFVCAIIVSFDHTIALYKSAGFNTSIGWMNSFTEQWLGKDFFTLALFATLAAEAAFSVGLWGLYEAFRVEQKFPGLRYKWTWGMFIGGLIVIGWSNIGGTLGTNYLFGNPVKGFVLGLSVPYFVLNAVLVNFSRSHFEEETHEQPVQQKLSMWAASLGNAVNTFREATKQSEHEHISKEQHEQIEPEQRRDEQQEDEQTNHEPGQTEHEQHEQHEHEEQTKPEQSESEQPEQTNKQSEREQQKRKLYIVNGGSKIDQAVQCALKMMERNEQFTVRELAKKVGCSTTTAQNALNRLKEQKQA